MFVSPNGPVGLYSSGYVPRFPYEHNLCSSVFG
jgi:hypothetical protein